MKEDKATIQSSPSIPPRKTENTPATPTASWAGDAIGTGQIVLATILQEQTRGLFVMQ